MATPFQAFCLTCGATWKSQESRRDLYDTVEYECGMRHKTRRGFSQVEVERRCPENAEEVKAEARRRLIDAKVAHALNALKVTHAECLDFVKRMDAGRYTKGRSVWDLLPEEPR